MAKDFEGQCLTKSDMQPIYSIKKGTPYAKVRKELLAQGYRPGVVPGNEGVHCDGACETPPEMLDCDGLKCRFYFERNKMGYVVHTVGDNHRYAGASYLNDSDVDEIRNRPKD